MEGLRLAEAAASSPTAQLSSGTQQLSLKSAPQALALLWRTHGWRCLYAGLSINYMKVIGSWEWHWWRDGVATRPGLGWQCRATKHPTACCVAQITAALCCGTQPTYAASN